MPARKSKKNLAPATGATTGPLPQEPMQTLDADEEATLARRRAHLEHVPLLFITDFRSRFKREVDRKSKCWGCRVNKMPMPKEPIGEDDAENLQCGCTRDHALLEMCCESLGIIGEERGKQEGKGHKSMTRTERQHLWEVLSYLEDADPLKTMLRLLQE
jgi:hypothetical protein